jgi:hypothetical protein
MARQATGGFARASGQGLPARQFIPGEPPAWVADALRAFSG